MLEAELWTISENGEGNTVFLRLGENGLIVPLFMDDTETRAILRAKEGPGEDGRPSAHDLLAFFIRESGRELVRAELYTREDDLFWARLVFSGAAGRGGALEAELCLEAAPSDALALAFRLKRPVFVSREAAEDTGVSEEQILETLGGISDTEDGNERS
jgi:bifunctional DNase/RNase